MYTSAIKRLKDIEKLHKVESFLLTEGRPINNDDIEMLDLLGSIMDDYTYGWYITNDDYFEQLKNINEFKIYILKLKD
jgi:hypothetical protein